LRGDFVSEIRVVQKPNLFHCEEIILKGVDIGVECGEMMQPRALVIARTQRKIARVTFVSGSV